MPKFTFSFGSPGGITFTYDYDPPRTKSSSESKSKPKEVMQPMSKSTKYPTTKTGTKPKSTKKGK